MPLEMSKRRWILWVLIASFAWLVVTRINEVENLADTLSRGMWQWVLAAALLQIGFFVTQAKIFHASFALVGVRAQVLELVPVYLGSMFINAVAPSVGTAGLALYVDDAVQRGESGARAAAGTLLGTIGTYTGFGIVLISGLIYLQLQGVLRFYEVIAAVALLLFTLLLSGLLVLGAAQPDWLRRILAYFQEIVNRAAARLRRSPPLSEEWSAEIADEFTAAAEAARDSPRGLAALLLWSTVSHLVNAASLYAVLLAFYEPSAVTVVLGAYAIGHLFVIVAPSPQGVGFVETVMPLTFTALGVPGAAATVIVLAYRGLAFWLPLLAGFFLLQRLRSLGAEGRALRDVWNVRIVVLFTALMGTVNIVSAVYPELARDLRRVTQYAPLQLRRGGQLGALLTGLALLLLANALWRRKRTAWYITLIVLFLSAVSHALNRSVLDFRLILTILLAGWLLVLRPNFSARSDSPSVRQGLLVIVGALVGIVLYGMVGIYLLAPREEIVPDLLSAGRQTLQTVFALRPPPWLLATASGQFLVYSIYSVSAVTLLYVFYLLLRPVLVRRPASPEERERAETLVSRYGRTPWSRATLQPGYTYFFSEGGSVVAFHFQGRAAVAMGDPIGPDDDRPATIASFAEHCRRNDWVPAFYQVSATNRPQYEARGFDSLVVGREAIVDLQDRDLADFLGDSSQQTVGRLLRQGYRAECLAPPHSREVVSELRLISDAWLTLMRTDESGFLLSWFDEGLVRESPVIVTYAPAGLIGAFATLILDRENDIVAVDLLRHRPQISEGTLDLLLYTVLSWAGRHETKRVNLGPGFPGALDDPATAGMLRYIYRDVDGADPATDFFEVKSRFNPRWSLRYLAYPGAASLPTVWAAIIRVASGARWPWHFLRRRLGW